LEQRDGAPWPRREKPGRAKPTAKPDDLAEVTQITHAWCGTRATIWMIFLPGSMPAVWATSPPSPTAKSNSSKGWGTRWRDRRQYRRMIIRTDDIAIPLV
jgi:hypothetical protein